MSGRKRGRAGEEGGMYGCVGDGGSGGVKKKPIVVDSTFSLTDTYFLSTLCVSFHRLADEYQKRLIR